MKKCGVLIEGQEYMNGDFLQFLDGSKMVDFYDEAAAREWVDENAFDEGAFFMGKYPDEIYIRESGWKSLFLYELALGQNDENWVLITFEVVSYEKGSD